MRTADSPNSYYYNDNDDGGDDGKTRVVRLTGDQLLNLPATAFEKKKKQPRKMPNRKPKKRLHEIDAPGPGPWWVFMLVNVTADEDTKKQTEVRLDTYPDLVQQIKNREDQGDWVIVMKIGPFFDMDIAGLVLSEWSDSTRGPGPRIAQGLCIWARYHKHDVNLWLINQSKKEVQEIYKRQKQEPQQAHVVFESLNLGGGARAGSVIVRDILKVTDNVGVITNPIVIDPNNISNDGDEDDDKINEMNGKRRKRKK